MINIEYVDYNELTVPPWRATYVLRPEMLIIAASLSQHGFIQPIHVRKESGEIIDGSERFLIASNIKQVLKKTNGLIPVVFHDVDQASAMMMHVQMNRGHSVLMAAKVSNIVRSLRRTGQYSAKDFESILCMRSEELSLMLDGDLIKTRKISEHNYARAWVPIEAPSNKSEDMVLIERPPNYDR
jgi:ParB-like chromosome segregation protein Spo0J